MPTPSGVRRRLLGRAASALAAVAVLSAAACGTGPADTPRITPGTSDHPRTVIVIARDYTFEPPVVDLVPGETVLVQVINGGLVAHEAVVGPSPVQDAWEAAEAPTASAPPGPTPQVSVEPDLAGLRIVVTSGERKDVTWTVPPIRRRRCRRLVRGLSHPRPLGQGDGRPGPLRGAGRPAPRHARGRLR